MADDKVVSLHTRKPVEEGKAAPSQSDVLKKECLEVLGDLVQRVENGEIFAFTFIGFSPDGLGDVTADTSGLYKNPAATIGAMEFHKNRFINSIAYETDED